MARLGSQLKASGSFEIREGQAIRAAASTAARAAVWAAVQPFAGARHAARKPGSPMCVVALAIDDALIDVGQRLRLDDQVHTAEVVVEQVLVLAVGRRRPGGQPLLAGDEELVGVPEFLRSSAPIYGKSFSLLTNIR
jgi:hypothetical protein